MFTFFIFYMHALSLFMFFRHLYFVLQNSDVLLAGVGVLCQPSHTSTCSLPTVKCTTRMTTRGARHARNVATQQLTRKCKLYSYFDHVVNFGTLLYTLKFYVVQCKITFHCTGFFDACTHEARRVWVRQSLVGLSAHCANSYILQHICTV